MRGSCAEWRRFRPNSGMPPRQERPGWHRRTRGAPVWPHILRPRDPVFQRVRRRQSLISRIQRIFHAPSSGTEARAVGSSRTISWKGTAWRASALGMTAATSLNRSSAVRPPGLPGRRLRRGRRLGEAFSAECRRWPTRLANCSIAGRKPWSSKGNISPSPTMSSSSMSSTYAAIKDIIGSYRLAARRMRALSVAESSQTVPNRRVNIAVSCARRRRASETYRRQFSQLEHRAHHPAVQWLLYRTRI